MGQALLKLGRPREALAYFERYKRSEETLTEDAQRLLSRTMADAQVQLEAERVLAEQSEKDQKEKLAKERAIAEKDRQERQKLQADAANLRAKLSELLVAKSQRPPLSDRERRRRVIGMLALSGVGLGLSVAGTVTLALDGFPACDRVSRQQLCPTHLESKLPGGLVLGIGLSALITSQVVLGLSFRATRAERAGESLLNAAGTTNDKQTPK